MALRAGWIAGLLAEYIAHAWMAAIVLGWVLVLGRRFPIGGFDRRQLRPWYVLALVFLLSSIGETVGSPPARSLHLPTVPTLAAQLVFLAFVVGPTEELLFRGLIQTSLNASIRGSLSIRGWRLGLGTLIAALLFGLFHLVNLGYQGLGATLEQVFAGAVIGLVIGVLYDRTGNLIGASLAHGVADFSATAIPLLAYLIAQRV